MPYAIFAPAPEPSLPPEPIVIPDISVPGGGEDMAAIASGSGVSFLPPMAPEPVISAAVEAAAAPAAPEAAPEITPGLPAPDFTPAAPELYLPAAAPEAPAAAPEAIGRQVQAAARMVAPMSPAAKAALAVAAILIFLYLRRGV